MARAQAAVLGPHCGRYQAGKVFSRPRRCWPGSGAKALPRSTPNCTGKKAPGPGEIGLRVTPGRWASTSSVLPASLGARLYQGACAVCHEVGGLPLFGSRPSLALNSNLHSREPDNLVQVILHGVMRPASSDLGYMPAFKDAMSDEQLAELVNYLRKQFAPDKPAWTDAKAAITRIRAFAP